MTNTLTKGQIAVLTGAAVPMIGFGVLGAIGTYANITSVFHRSATALGVVASGEGATLVLALVAVGLVMLGQSVPAPVRIGLWALPLLAAATGAAVAATPTEAVVFAVTPMAMTVSAEGLGLLARRIVVHRTGIDAEVQRRNAETVQRLAYHRARAANHPSKRARKRSERAAWRLAKRVGVGDAELGTQLVEVQRERLREGADGALAGMFGTTPAKLPESPTLAEHFAEAAEVVTPQVPAEVTVERVKVPPVTPPEVTATPPVPDLVRQIAAPAKHLIICGDRKVWHLQPPALDDEEEVTGEGADRLPTEQAANVIRAAWVLGTSVAETARLATRSTSYVKKVFARLEETRNAEPAKPITLVRSEASA